MVVHPRLRFQAIEGHAIGWDARKIFQESDCQSISILADIITILLVDYHIKNLYIRTSDSAVYLKPCPNWFSVINYLKS